MVPGSLFRPLDLGDALDDAYDEGDDAVIALLAEALTDPRARGDAAVAEYLEPLVEAYRETGRERDGIATFNRIAEANPGLRGEITDIVAELHAYLGEHDVALDLLRQRHVEQTLRRPEHRDIGFYVSAAMAAGGLIDDRDLAYAWASEGQRLALQRQEPREVVVLLGGLRARFRPAHPTTDRDLDDAAMRYLRAGSAPAGQPQRVHYRFAYLPEREYAVARERGLLDVTMHPAHEDYRREEERALREAVDTQGVSACVVPLDVAGMLEYAAREGKDPASRQTRMDYNDSLEGAGRDIPWPPERNAPCWCGSGRKYKKCCGAPGFLAVEPPAPASLVLKIELDDVRPLVWRRVAVPSTIRLDRLHGVIQDAMGWHDEHLYAFDADGVSYLDPRSDSPEPKADDARILALAHEPGQRFGYVYDFGDGWSHTITLEEVRVAGSDNEPRLLEGAGTCPPEDCGGPGAYMTLLHARNDPADPRHDEALEWLGEESRAPDLQVRDVPVAGDEPSTPRRQLVDRHQRPATLVASGPRRELLLASADHRGWDTEHGSGLAHRHPLAVRHESRFDARSAAGGWSGQDVGQDMGMGTKAFTGQRLRDFLVAQSPVWLTEQLLRAADRDPALSASLRLAASDRRGVDAVRRELDRAIWVGEDEEVDEEDAPTYVAGVEGALELVERLVADGYADEAIGLVEHAIDLLSEVLDRVYDEGESVGCLHYAKEIHLQACVAGSPDPVALAEWLFRRAVSDVAGWGAFDTALADYAEVLGRAGTDRFRDLVEAEWRRLPRLAAGEHSDLRHQAVLRLAEQHARADGIDAVVEVLAKDLTTAERYVRVCEELVAAGRIQPALEWARRGLDEFDERTDRGWNPGLPELRQLAVTLYARLGRTAEAVELAWRDFVTSPSVETYQRLREQGIADGTWPGWRERALAELRSKPRASVPASSAGPYSWQPVGHSVLVSVLLFEDDDEAAWRAARDGGCTEGLWLELARRRARQLPADAIEVFRRQIEAAIALTKREGYEQAARLLIEAGACYERMGKAAEFAGYVQQLRADHRRKRNLTTALDAARLPR